MASPGFAISAMRLAQALPKTTMSSRELAPRRLAPWTEAEAASPAAKRPGTTWSDWKDPSGANSVRITSPRWLVGIPEPYGGRCLLI